MQIWLMDWLRRLCGNPVAWTDWHMKRAARHVSRAEAWRDAAVERGYADHPA